MRSRERERASVACLSLYIHLPITRRNYDTGLGGRKRSKVTRGKGGVSAMLTNIDDKTRYDTIRYELMMPARNYQTRPVAVS